MWWAPLAAGGLSAIGNWFSANAESDAIRAGNEAEQARYMDMVRRQEEFAKHGLQWKMDDARRAGIHPLYALGAQTQSFSPISVGSTPDTSRAGFLKDTGQDISRAVQQTLTPRDQEISKLQLGMAQAQLDGQIIENQIKASQLRQMNTPTAFPGNSDLNFIPGQPNADILPKRPDGIRRSDTPWAHAGEQPDVDFSRTRSGRAPQIPQQLAESMEDSLVQRMQWYLRNLVVPILSSKNSQKPSLKELPKGAVDWTFHPLSMEWRPQYPVDGRKKAREINSLFGGRR